MRIIRASEIGRYLYCRRSWFYHLQGIQPANTRELNLGTELHAAHGRKVAGSLILQVIAIIAFLVAILILFSILVK